MAALVVPVGVGCKSATPATQVYRVSGTLDVSATTALRAWNDWIPIGKPTIDRELAVKGAWDKYQAAQIAVLDAAVAYKQTADVPTKTRMDAAIASAASALGDLITIIRLYGVKGV